MPMDDEFSTLWVDRPGAEDRLKYFSIGSPEAQESLRSFVVNGYAILKGAVSHEVIDRYLSDVDDPSVQAKLKASYGADIFPLSARDKTQPLTKILDSYVYLKSAQEMIFADKINSFLFDIFHDAALAFQSLHFEVGSTQVIHQDTSYVVIDKPLNMAASWIALEDIEEGSGELAYYPGSHRWPHYLYGNGRKHWNASIDGPEPHDKHLQWIRDQAKERGVEKELFRPKKGDALIWHANLAHGGSPITKPGVTRKSFVTHYCPSKNSPSYFQYLKEEWRVTRPAKPTGTISTFYYDPAEMV